MSATRQCFASLPDYLNELPNGPRIGPVNRAGYEPAYDAAGQPFPFGERDYRNELTVDNLPRKLANPLAAFDRTGTAGLCSPRVEVRAITVDDPIRRARSSPPDLAATRLVQQSSMQAFGLKPEIDTPRFRRRVYSAQSSTPTRDQAQKMAARYSNIDEIVAKKHFHGTAAPGAWMSPRYAARCTELIDIDAHGGRMMSPRRELAVESILPQQNGSFELTASNEWTFEQTPRPHNMAYFAKTLEAEKYAKLLGRPQSRPRTEFATKNVLKLENLQKRERGWQRYSSTTKDRTESCASLDMYACDWSVSSEPNSPLNHAVRTRMVRSLSAISTTASEEGSVRSDREPPLSKASRSIFNSFDESDCKNYTWGCVAEDLDYEGHSPKKVPLGIRRVMASMMPDAIDLTDSMASQLQAAIGATMRKLERTPVRSKNVRTRATRAIQRQNISSPSRRNVSAPLRNRKEWGEMEDPSASNKRPLPVAVAG